MLLNWPEAQHIYLSPHLDDVVLSCGGMIFQQAARGEQVAVITVFAASPLPGQPLSKFAQLLHFTWQQSAPPGSDFSDPVATRRAEDRAAFAVLSPAIEVIHHPLADCVYRQHPETGAPLYGSLEAIFATVDPADPALDALRETSPLPADVLLYVPLTAGHHVDHQIVRGVVEGWDVPPNRVRYYEDYPYADQEEAVKTALGDPVGWQEAVIPLSDEALDAKVRAIACHASQIGSFWSGTEQMAAEVTRYAGRVGGERLWRRVGPPEDEE